MRRVEQIMGMPITIDIPDCDDETVFKTVFVELEDIDRSYSNYKTNSEITKFARGEISKEEISQGLSDILEGCKTAERDTNGYFSAWARGSLDANGYIKGWAIKRAASLLEGLANSNFCIAAGGDVLAHGRKTWNVGIQDPSNKTKIAKIINLANQAIATSGNYERGQHIINPKTGQAADYWASVSVVGPDIIKADVLATACFAMGKNAEELIKKQPGYRLICIDKLGGVTEKASRP